MLPRGLPASVAVPPPPLGLLVHGGAGRPGTVLPRSRYRRARRPPMLRWPYAPAVLPFFSAGAEKRERRASFYNIIRNIFQPGASLDSRLRYAKNIRYYVNNTPLLLRQRSLRSSELP